MSSKRKIIKIYIFAQQVFKPNSFRFIKKPTQAARFCCWLQTCKKIKKIKNDSHILKHPKTNFLPNAFVKLAWKVTCFPGPVQIQTFRPPFEVSCHFSVTFDLVMICSYSLAKDIIPNVALMIHIQAVVLQEAPGFGEIKTFPLTASV